MHDIPWVAREVKVGDNKVTIVEGDVMTLERMFTDLPDFHKKKSHSTIASVEKYIGGAGNKDEHGYDEDYDEENRHEFVNAKSFTEILNHVTVKGRDDITKLANERLAGDEAREIVRIAGTKATRPRAEYGDEGDEVDCDRMRLGEDDTAWKRIVRHETRKRSRTVTIDVNVIIPAFVDQDSFVWNGVQTAVIVDALEAEGYRVEVNALQLLSVGAIDNEGYNKRKFCSRVRIKRAEDPLRIDLLAYQTGCVAFTRGALWRCLHAHRGDISGYGWNDVSRGEVRALAMGSAHPERRPDHVLPAVTTESQAMEAIKEVLEHYAPAQEVA